MTNITEDIKYIGVNDREIDLFEGQYEVPNGMAYNSYVILDEKIAVMDTVDRHFTAEWLKNLESALAGRQPDYLIVQHMEPDHSAGIAEFSAAYPDAGIVGNDKTFTMKKNFYGGDFIKNSRFVKTTQRTRSSSRRMRSASSARATRTRTGRAKREDTISASSENTAGRFRRCSRRLPLSISPRYARSTAPRSPRTSAII